MNTCVDFGRITTCPKQIWPLCSTSIRPPYSSYELGDLNIPISSLKKLAEHFQTSVDYLIGLTDQREPYPRAKE